MSSLSRSSLYLTGSLFAFMANPASAGIHFGDPVASHARQDAGIGIDWWELPVYELVLTPCGGGQVTHHSVNTTYSPTTGMVAPLGSWCEVVIVPSGDFVLIGETPDHYDLDITLEVGDITLTPGSGLSIVSGASTETGLIELLGVDWWDNQVAPYVGTGQAVTIDANHARHDALVGSMENASSFVIAPL